MKLTAQQSGSKSLTDTWRDWRGFIGFVAFMLVFRSAIADWNHVPSSSMLPSILIGDRVIVNKLAYDLRIPFTFIRVTQWADPERSDIVTFESPKDGRLMIKRVIGLPGDTISLRDNRDNSGDYRAIGFVPRRAILGRASSVAFSFDVDNYYLPRSDRLMRSLRN